jgi:membrane fusion protein (multidrug efflux system)
MPDDPRLYAPHRPGKLFIVGGLAAVVIALIVAGALMWARDTRVRQQTAQLEEEAAQGRRVLVTHARQAPPSRSLAVPATIHGFVETPIYAKIAGYLKTINVDKGDHVTPGQVLAVLDAPEIDQQVANARANYNLQELTNRRNQELAERALIARQAADETYAALLQAKANLDQLEAMQNYKVIRAPFAGIVVARNVDPGALIPQATASSGGSPIVTLATLSPVRVYADVPQSSAPFVQNGDLATITVT